VFSYGKGNRVLSEHRFFLVVRERVFHFALRVRQFYVLEPFFVRGKGGQGEDGHEQNHGHEHGETFEQSLFHPISSPHWVFSHPNSIVYIFQSRGDLCVKTGISLFSMGVVNRAGNAKFSPIRRARLLYFPFVIM
jgi:hypothetical protein